MLSIFAPNIQFLYFSLGAMFGKFVYNHLHVQMFIMIYVFILQCISILYTIIHMHIFMYFYVGKLN